MTLSDHLRLVWPMRPFVMRGDSITFDDGLPAPSADELAATQAQALELWQAEQLRHSAPPPVTRRQLKVWLHGQGLLTQVPALIAAISDVDARALAQIDWDEAAVFDVTHPLVVSFATALGLSTEQLHAAWREAGAIQ